MTADNQSTSRQLQAALSKWDNEGGALAHRSQPGDLPDVDVPQSVNTELDHLHIRMIATENLLIALLAQAPDQTRELGLEMASYISPRPGFTRHPRTLAAAAQMLHLLERSRHFQNGGGPLTPGATSGASAASANFTPRSIDMYERILVPVDGSPTSNAGLVEAIKLAKLTGARVRVLHVIDESALLMSGDGFVPVPGDVYTLLKENGQAVLQAARVMVDAAGVPVDTVLFDNFTARLSDRVTEQVNEWGANVIVLGTHGRRGVERLLMGSDAEQIVRVATVPVLLVCGIDPEVDHPAASDLSQATAQPL
jgi:nucleotide-binding universal stress UspA family protein